MLRVFPFISIFYFLVLFFFSSILLSQESKTIYLKNADNLFGTEINGEQVRELSGNVEFFQGNIFLKCNKAIQYLSSNKVEVIGNVILSQDTLKLFTENGVYFGDSKITSSPSKVRITDGIVELKANSGKYEASQRLAIFYNNVVFNDKKNTIYSDTTFYYRDSSKIFAYGKVKIVSDDNNIIYCDTLEHYRNNKYSILRGNPQLIRFDSTNITDSIKTSYKVDTLFVKSKLLISDRSEKNLLIAIDSVKFLRNEISFFCKKLTNLTKDSIFILEKDPVIWYQKSQIFADSITLFIKNKNINKIVASNNAFMLSEADSLFPELFNQIMGDTITLYFSDNKLDSILAIQKAIAFYFQTDSSGINSGYKSSGDKIKIESLNNKLKSVRILYGIESFYYPANMLKGKIMEYNLPRFKILTHKPKREDYYNR